MVGKTAVVSGSSKGIGEGIALELSARGANIVLNYPFPSLKSECEAVGARLQTQWLAICADLSTREGADQLIQEAVARFRYIDILVNNAGIVPMAPLWDADPHSWDTAMSLNARGTFLLTKAALPHLTPYKPSDPPQISGALNGSRIIIVGSAASRMPRVGQGVYAATKGAVDGMLKVWAQELPAKYGCTVNAVGPGPVVTETFTCSLGEDYEIVEAEATKMTPVEGSFASVQDVAWAVAFLAEERSRFLNGVFLPISGGRYIM